ncbi:hypothetical protein CHS0354_003533 [Potamilus streckersoni]|uniref:Uncharacterized protein n=1 Tax=Potamilus streckersoni TaxID=2493646 RepID=A0AAE0RVX5_9BIVA|nr:hypothetical protein CHS0354_003533 [Potamilus streckersoni]
MEEKKQKDTANIKAELSKLTRRHLTAVDEEKKELRDFSEAEKTLIRAENIRKNKRERIQKIAHFTANPFDFGKRLSGSKRLGRPQCTKGR